MLGIFYYRTPESRARRLAKCMEELLGKEKSKDREEEF
jgi:hypothetical protein